MWQSLAAAFDRVDRGDLALKKKRKINSSKTIGSRVALSQQ